MTTNWDNLFKVKIANPSNSMMKHEVVKLILVIKLLEKYKGKRNWIRIYTEFELENGLKPDVYLEDIKTKSAIAFEIQKKYTPEWLKDRTSKYKEYLPYNFNSFDWIPIDLNEFSGDIEQINDKLEDFII